MVRVQVKDDMNHLFHIDLHVFRMYSRVCMLIVKKRQKTTHFFKLNVIRSGVFCNVLTGISATKMLTYSNYCICTKK